MTSINTQKTYEFQDLVNPKSTSIRQVTASVDGSTRVDSEGDTSLFKKSNEMGKDAFLNLLVTQLRYQDPLNPAADTEFVAQLAQFSSLENSQTMVKSISDLSAGMKDFMTLQTLNSQSVVNAQSVGLLGKRVRVSSPEITYSGKPVVMNIQPYEGKSEIFVAVKNAQGQMVSLEKVDVNPGEPTRYTWDGLKDDNTPAPSGKYSVEIMDSTQSKVTGSVYVEGTVEAIRYTESGANIQINGKSYLPKNILHVVNG